MPVIKPTCVRDLKLRVNLADVVSRVVTLKKAGAGRLKGLCPFHNEKTPSFNVDADKGFFKCFGCGKAGDLISFVRETEQLGFTEAVEALGQLVQSFTLLLANRPDALRHLVEDRIGSGRAALLGDFKPVAQFGDGGGCTTRAVESLLHLVEIALERRDLAARDDAGRNQLDFRIERAQRVGHASLVGAVVECIGANDPADTKHRQRACRVIAVGFSHGQRACDEWQGCGGHGRRYRHRLARGLGCCALCGLGWPGGF